MKTDFIMYDEQIKCKLLYASFSLYNNILFDRNITVVCKLISNQRCSSGAAQNELDRQRWSHSERSGKMLFCI